MKRTFQALAILMGLMLAAIWLVGCGGGKEVGPAAEFKEITPPEGSTIAGNAELTIKLTNPVKADTKLTVNGTDATGSGASWKWKPATPLTPGAATITIEWTNPDDSTGSKTVTYTVTAPDTTPPKIKSSTPKDGAKDVDPEKINKDGMEIVFDEPLKKVDIAVTVEGEALKWSAALSDDKTKATLSMIKGGDISYETEVVLEITAEDLAGNKADLKITFTTKAKE